MWAYEKTFHAKKERCGYILSAEDSDMEAADAIERIKMRVIDLSTAQIVHKHSNGRSSSVQIDNKS